MASLNYSQGKSISPRPIQLSSHRLIARDSIWLNIGSNLVKSNLVKVIFKVKLKFFQIFQNLHVNWSLGSDICHVNWIEF